MAESVEYDAVGNRFLAGSDMTSIVEIDTLGNFSYFGEGLTSNLGMEIMQGHLFSIVGQDMINVYDLETELLISSVTITGAQFLNGMASNGISKLWVTDFVGRAIYELDFSNLSEATYTALAGMAEIPNLPNGIIYDEANNRLVFVSWNDGVIRQLDLEDNSVNVVIEDLEISNMDGIDMDSQNNYYVASWSPESRITKFSSDFSESEILDIPGISNPADICIANEINLLAIPSFQHDVIFWPLEETTTGNTNIEQSNSNNIDIFPNPSNGKFFVQITNQQWTQVGCQLIDARGVSLNKWTFQHNQMNGLELDLSAYPDGLYTLSISIDGGVKETRNVILAK